MGPAAGRKPAAVHLWTSGYSDPGGWTALDAYWQTIQYPDINGDGRDDVCGRASGGLYCNVSSGAAFGGAFYWSNAYGDSSGWASDASRWQTLQFQDVNGDGRADACSRAVEGVTCVVK